MSTIENITLNAVPASVFTLWREVSALDLDTREIVANMLADDRDFEADGYRFIHMDDIDKIQQDELSGDEYVLGCFNAWFLADVLGIDTDVIESMQQAEAFEAIGKLVISMGKLDELQAAYASADGYGHHFAHYDGCEHEIGSYYAFRVN